MFPHQDHVGHIQKCQLFRHGSDKAFQRLGTVFRQSLRLCGNRFQQLCLLLPQGNDLCGVALHLCQFFLCTVTAFHQFVTGTLILPT